MTGAPRPAPTRDRDEVATRLHLAPRRRPGRIGEVHVLQLLLLEVVLLGVVATGLLGWPALAGAAVPAALLLLLTFRRNRGRWWWERLAMDRGYRVRRRGGTPAGDDPRLGALHRLAPGLSVQDVAMADGAQIGVARDDAGWFAVAAVTSADPMRDAPGGLPLDALAAALAEADQRGSVLQVVTRTVAASGPQTDPGAPANESYRQLLAALGPVPVPARRTTWVAVRLDARALAESLADYAVDLEIAPSVVAALLRRVAKALRRADVPHRLLDADDLLTAVARGCGLDGAGPAGGAPGREEWTRWQCGPVAHRSYWLRRWPPLDRAADLLSWLGSAPAAVTTVSLTLAPGGPGEDLDLRALVRVTAEPERLAPLGGSLEQGVRQAGGELFPLDGEQGPAVYASAPTGGGAG